MNSVGYSTFYIDLDQNNDNDTDLLIDSKKQCLICLQGPIRSNNIIMDDVKLINQMHFLIKECKCECYSHHKCIEQWIDNNSICPICRGPISFPKSGIKEEIIQMPITQATEHHELILIQQPDYGNHVCIRVTIVLCLCFVWISIFNLR
jgi:hypothetical protein